MNEKTIEAALLAWHTVVDRHDYNELEEIRVALLAATPPLRAREEIARAILGCRLSYGNPSGDIHPDDARKLADAILSRTAGQEWRDISSASEVLKIADLWVVHSESGGRREANGSRDRLGDWRDQGSNPLNWNYEEDDGTITTSRVTHWMPLPAPPVTEPPPAGVDREPEYLKQRREHPDE